MFRRSARVALSLKSGPAPETVTSGRRLAATRRFFADGKRPSPTPEGGPTPSTQRPQSKASSAADPTYTSQKWTRNPMWRMILLNPSLTAFTVIITLALLTIVHNRTKNGPFGNAGIVRLETSDNEKDNVPTASGGPPEPSRGRPGALNKGEATGGNDGEAWPIKVETKESVAELSSLGSGDAEPKGVRSPVEGPREVVKKTGTPARVNPPEAYSAKPAK